MHVRRQALAARYRHELAGVEELILPEDKPDRVHSWHLFALRLRLDRLTLDRAAFIEALKQREIMTSVHWKPLHMHPYYESIFGFRADELPVAARLFPSLVSLPLYPKMADDDVVYVCESIKAIVASARRKPA